MKIEIAIINEGPMDGTSRPWIPHFLQLVCLLVLNSLPDSHLDQHSTCLFHEAHCAKLYSTRNRISGCSQHRRAEDVEKTLESGLIFRSAKRLQLK